MSLAISQPVPAQEKISIDNAIKERFKSAQYHIEQPYVQLLNEGYTILASDNDEKYTANRPRHVLHSFFAFGLGIVAFLTGVFFALVTIFPKDLKPEDAETMAGTILLLAFLSLLFGYFCFHTVKTVAGPLRKATVKDAAGNLVMRIEPVSRFHLFHSEFAIRDERGALLAKFRRDFWTSIFQVHWRASDANGRYLFTAIEDNLVMSLLRRYLNLARFIPMHFSFSKGGGKPFGEFQRRRSLRDKYLLKYNPAAADGFLMVATGILLDTGEGR